MGQEQPQAIIYFRWCGFRPAYFRCGLTWPRWSDWNPITREQIFSASEPLASYSGTKTFAERAVWEFAAERPDINITVCKYMVFGLDDVDPWINSDRSEPAILYWPSCSGLPRPTRGRESFGYQPVYLQPAVRREQG